jgi:hypothetical protein
MLGYYLSRLERLGNMDLIASPSISFPEAIELTKNFVDRLEIENLTDREIEEIVGALVQSHNGARGFFVGYLTDDRACVDRPKISIIKALRAQGTVISDLLVKNLAMSAAMVITHQRNGDAKMQASSARVCRRSAKVIGELQLESIEGLLQELRETIANGTGTYQDFLKRWGYDTEQLAAIDRVTTAALVKKP